MRSSREGSTEPVSVWRPVGYLKLIIIWRNVFMQTRYTPTLGEEEETTSSFHFTEGLLDNG